MPSSISRHPFSILQKSRFGPASCRDSRESMATTSVRSSPVRDCVSGSKNGRRTGSLGCHRVAGRRACPGYGPNENARRRCARRTEAGRTPFQFVSEHTESGAAVEDVNLISDAHFDAGGVASVAHVLGLWSGRRPAYAPKLHVHNFDVRRRSSLRELPRKHSFYLGYLRFYPLGTCQQVTKVSHFGRIWEHFIGDLQPPSAAGDIRPVLGRYNERLAANP